MLERSGDSLLPFDSSVLWCPKSDDRPACTCRSTQHLICCTVAYWYSQAPRPCLAYPPCPPSACIVRVVCVCSPSMAGGKFEIARYVLALANRSWSEDVRFGRGAGTRLRSEQLRMPSTCVAGRPGCRGMCEAGLVRRCCKKLNVSKHSAASIVPTAEEYEHALRYHEALAILSQPCRQRCCSCTWRRSTRWLLRPKGHHARARACAILALWEVLTMMSLMAIRCFLRRMQLRKVAI
mgnify:CR=1 FL=1